MPPKAKTKKIKLSEATKKNRKLIDQYVDDRVQGLNPDFKQVSKEDARYYNDKKWGWKESMGERGDRFTGSSSKMQRIEDKIYKPGSDKLKAKARKLLKEGKLK